MPNLLQALQMSKVNHKVIIIGAGIAGIAAATRLYENGIKDIVILEAEDRIGGRIHSVEYDQHIIEFGAQWCHGESENVVYDLVKNFDILKPSYNDYFYKDYYESSGQKLDKDITKIFDEIGLKVWSESKSWCDSNELFGDYFTRR